MKPVGSAKGRPSDRMALAAFPAGVPVAGPAAGSAGPAQGPGVADSGTLDWTFTCVTPYA